MQWFALQWIPLHSIANVFHRNGIHTIGMDTYGLITNGAAVVGGGSRERSGPSWYGTGGRIVDGIGFPAPVRPGNGSEAAACARPFAAR